MVSQAYNIRLFAQLKKELNNSGMFVLSDGVDFIVGRKSDKKNWRNLLEEDIRLERSVSSICVFKSLEKVQDCVSGIEWMKHKELRRVISDLVMDLRIELKLNHELSPEIEHKISLLAPDIWSRVKETFYLKEIGL